jgi:S-layer family protein
MSLRTGVFRLVPPLLILVATGLAAQTAPAASREPAAFGTTTQSVLVVGSYAFQERFPTAGILPTIGLDRYSATAFLEANIQLPAGSQLEKIELGACDNSDTQSVSLGVGACTTPGSSCDALASLDTGTTETPGCDFFSQIVSPPEPIDSSYPIALVVSTGPDSTTTFSVVKLDYRMRVSPAPATATFADVPTSHLYFRTIEALAASGITVGCGNGNFCPDQAVTRGELAKFLANALGLHWPN